MKEEFGLVKKENTGLTITSSGTGITVIDSYEAASGFNYSIGVREFGDLIIVEEVGQGTAVSYLNGIRVFNKQKELVIDVKVKDNTHYSRETVRRLVRDELIKMLSKAALKEGKSFDKTKAFETINSKLNDAYYEQSYQAVIEWAKEIGIEMK